MHIYMQKYAKICMRKYAYICQKCTGKYMRQICKYMQEYEAENAIIWKYYIILY